MIWLYQRMHTLRMDVRVSLERAVSSPLYVTLVDLLWPVVLATTPQTSTTLGGNSILMTMIRKVCSLTRSLYGNIKSTLLRKMESLLGHVRSEVTARLLGLIRDRWPESGQSIVTGFSSLLNTITTPTTQGQKESAKISFSIITLGS